MVLSERGKEQQNKCEKERFFEILLFMPFVVDYVHDITYSL